MSEFSKAHYDFNYELTEDDKIAGFIKVDPYFVNKTWGLNKKDDTGVIFHQLKTIARFSDKNPVEREVKALYNQVLRLAELHGIQLEE